MSPISDTAVMNVRVHDPFDVGDADVARTKALFEDAGLVVGQTVGDYGGGLVKLRTTRFALARSTP